MKKAGKETTLSNESNGSIVDSAIALWEKSPVVASVILILVAATPVLAVIFTYLGKVSDNKVKRHAQVLKYRIELAKIEKGQKGK